MLKLQFADNIYVGIKGEFPTFLPPYTPPNVVGSAETGYFQHSSFLAGGMVTSAGLIKVKEGQIRSISPLSGHYRTSHDVCFSLISQDC